MSKKWIVLGLIVASQAYGGNVNLEKEYAGKLNESVITTERYDETPVIEIAKNATVITSEDIEKRGYTSVEDALNMVPGLFYADGNYSMRGQVPKLADKTLVVLVDGVPQNGMDNRKYDFDTIPIEQITKIEVLPSGGAIMYGGNATAGVINIVTKDNLDAQYWGEFGTEFGSFQHKKLNVNAGTKITKKLTASVDYSINNKHGYRNDEKNDLDFLQVATDYKLEDGKVGFKYNFNKRVGDERIGALSKEEYEENRKMNKNPGREGKDKQNKYILTFDKKLNNSLEASAVVEYRDRNYKYKYPEETSISKNKKTITPAYTKRNKDTDSLYTNVQLKYSYGDNSSFIFGGDYSKAKVKEKSYTYDKKDKTVYLGSDSHIDFKSIGGYALNKISYDSFIFTQGIRVEKNEFDEDVESLAKKKMGLVKPLRKEYSHTKYSPTNTDVELTANYLLDDEKSVFLSYERVKRSPSLTEYSSWDKAESPDRKAQTMNTIELGTKALVANTYLAGSIFYIHGDKEIMYDPRNGAMSGESFYNLDGKTERTGVEFSSEQYFGSLTLREEFTYMHNKIKDGPYSGNKIPGVPTFMCGLGVTYEIVPNMFANIDTIYHGKAYAANDFKNEFDKAQSYTIINLSLRYSLKNGLSVYGGMKNIFGKKYCDYTYVNVSKGVSEIKYSPAPERTYYVGMEYKF
ncbi:TonB-dependent receptor [Fusobacterium sp.]|uniref:TonB-dependent receptor n=1 Tax=Fusobacterium sp. TaxID=68766 RepID=UPI00396C3338